MKKLLVTILAMCMIFSLAACGSSDNTSAATEAPKTTEATEAPTTAESVDLNESVTSSGKLSGGMTAAEHPEITTEGKSQDTILTISQNVDIAGIDAFAAAQSGRNDIRYLIYDQLAIMAKPGGSIQEMAFQMAKTITEVDDTTLDIEIYDYIHDWAGNAVTADDVVWCYNKMAESGVSGKFSRLFGSMEKTGDYSVRLTLASPTLGAAQYLLQFCPIVSKAGYESQTDGEHAQKPIGTGGYKITDYVSGGYCYLERVEDYWQTDASLRSYAYTGQAKQIKLIVQTESAQRDNALLTGQADVATRVSSTDITLFRNEDGTPKDGYNVLAAPNSTTYYLPFNCAEGHPLSNIELRKAVACAIDAKGVMAGTHGANGFLFTKEVANPMLADYNKEWLEEDYYDYNLDEAKKHLEASGMTDVKLVMMTSTEDNEKSYGIFVQQYLAQIGIEVEIKSYDAAPITEYIYNPDLWDIRIDALGNSDYCADAWNLYTTQASGVSKFLIVDEKLDELVAAAGGISTHSAETVEAVHDYAYEMCYYVPLGNQYVYSAASDKLEIWPLHPYNFLLFGGFIFD